MFPRAKALADCVIPAEYGISPDFKLRIGHKIAKELIGKLMVDLDNVKAESFSADQDLIARAAGDAVAGGEPAAAAGVAGSEAEAPAVKGGDDDVQMHGSAAGEEVCCLPFGSARRGRLL